MADEKLGKYEIRGQLGRGAMGTVYDGWDPIIARRVAIKTVRLPDPADAEAQDELARFRREAQAAGRLTHPNIVGVFDYGETDTVAFIVMEFVDGRTLKSIVDKDERLPLPEIARIMNDMLAGLQFSHDRGVVHRDIKPANVMLTVQGQAKIADFGIARIESSSMTQAGTVLGTPAYMSPEQFMGHIVDLRTDIYSSGVLLYQMLTGERPFDGSMTAIMHKALNTAPPKPSDLTVSCPRAFDEVVSRAMAKRPEDRFASAGAMAEAISAALVPPAPVAAPVADALGPSSLDQLLDTEATMVAPRRPTPSVDETVIAVAPRPTAATMPPPPIAAANTNTSAGPGRRGSGAVIAAASGLAVLAALGGGGYFLFGSKESTPAIVASLTTAAPGAGPTPPLTSGAGGAANPASSATPPPVADTASTTPAAGPAPTTPATAAAPSATAPIRAPTAAQTLPGVGLTPTPAASSTPRPTVPASPPPPPPTQATSTTAPPRPTGSALTLPPATQATVPTPPTAAASVAPQAATTSVSPSAPRPATNLGAIPLIAAASAPGPAAAATVAAPSAVTAPTQGATQFAALVPVPGPSTPPSPGVVPTTPSVPPPIAVQPTRLSPAALRQAVTAATAAAQCAMVSADPNDSATSLTISGLAGNAGMAALRQAVELAAPGVDVAWQVAGFDGPYCPALNAIQAVNGRGTGLATVPSKTVLKDNDLLTLQATLPDFPAHLTIDYLGSDGTVTHLVPTTPDVADYSVPDKLYPARSRARFGDAAPPKYDGLRVGPPFGTDMILVVAAQAPLLAPRRLQQEDKPASYLAELQSAIDAARRRGARVAATAFLLDITP